MSQHLASRKRCTHCGGYLFRVVAGNVVDWSHNPNLSGATKCPSK